VFEIVVADQNPAWPENQLSELSQIKSDPRVIWLLIEPPGVVAARHRAVERSKGEILLFVDDDIVVPHPNLIRHHVRNYGLRQVSAVVGRERAVADPTEPQASLGAAPEYLPSPVGLSALQQTLWFNRNGDRPQWICTFCTCNSSIRRDVFLAVGGFDELFAGNAYGDDYDLAIRLHGLGFATVYDPGAWLIHRRVQVGGLRLTDRTNTSSRTIMSTGLWLFVFRHGHRGMYWQLIYGHVLRKTVLLRHNALHPGRQIVALIQLLRALPSAYKHRRSPRLAFAKRSDIHNTGAHARERR